MTHPFFISQVDRLIVRFGDKSLDREFCKLAWGAVKDMSEKGFERFVDVMIGSRPHTKPPLLSEFREACQLESNRKFQDDVRGATDFLSKKAPDEMRQQLRKVLSREYGAVESVKDAFEIARIRFLTERI